MSLLCVRAVLSSRAVASQVFSPLMSLTTVFEMGTGVPSSPLTRTYFSFPEKKSELALRCLTLLLSFQDCSMIPYQYHLVKTIFGDPWENRTPVCGVRGRRLDRLTNGPYLVLTLLFLNWCKKFMFP